jgi:hypothetical protein
MRHRQQKLGCFSTAKLFMDMDDMDDIYRTGWRGTFELG